MAFSQFSTGASSEVNFIPEIFSKLLQAKFYNASVLPAISNTDYEGEISAAGDKVTVRTVPAVTISDYAGSLTYHELATSKIELLIDKAKSYSFKVDDVLKAQSDIDMIKEATTDAAEAMRIAVETDVLANVYAGGTSGAGTDTTITTSNILSEILTMSKTLDERNIPEDGRFIVMSPEFISLLKQTELRQAYLTGDATSPLRNGQVGTIDRFTVYQSNMLPVVSGHTQVIAGHPKGITFASQFTNAETLRLENSFGDAVRGLKVYGSKVITPECIVAGSWT